MNHYTVRWCGCCLLLCRVLSAYAEESPLGLDEAVTLATQGAPQMTGRQAAIEGAQAMSEGAGRLPDPEVVAGIDNLPINGPDAYSLGNDFMTMRKIGVMQTFNSGAKRAAQRHEAQALVSVAEADVSGGLKARRIGDISRI